MKNTYVVRTQNGLGRGFVFNAKVFSKSDDSVKICECYKEKSCALILIDHGAIRSIASLNQRVDKVFQSGK